MCRECGKEYDNSDARDHEKYCSHFCECEAWMRYADYRRDD